MRHADREAVKQKLPAIAKMIIEIRETRFAFHRSMRSCSPWARLDRTQSPNAEDRSTSRAASSRACSAYRST